MKTIPSLAVDGYDGAGKSTLVAGIAELVGGRPVAPFQGNVGNLLLWLCRRGRYSEAVDVSQSAIEKVIEENSGAQALIFDRHWVSLQVLMPDPGEAAFVDVPPTVVCWTDPATTTVRLNERGQNFFDTSHHIEGCQRYLGVAAAHGLPVVDTTGCTPVDAVRDAARTLLGGTRTDRALRALLEGALPT